MELASFCTSLTAWPSATPGAKIERDRDRRKLAGVVDCERTHAGSKFRDGAERNQLARRGMDVKIREHVGIALEALLHLENNPVFIVGGIDGRDQSLAVSAVKSVFDLLWRHSQGRGFVAVNHNVGLRILDLEVAGDVRRGPATSFIFCSNICAYL